MLTKFCFDFLIFSVICFHFYFSAQHKKSEKDFIFPCIAYNLHPSSQEVSTTGVPFKYNEYKVMKLSLEWIAAVLGERERVSKACGENTTGDRVNSSHHKNVSILSTKSLKENEPLLLQTLAFLWHNNFSVEALVQREFAHTRKKKKINLFQKKNVSRLCNERSPPCSKEEMEPLQKPQLIRNRMQRSRVVLFLLPTSQRECQHRQFCSDNPQMIFSLITWLFLSRVDPQPCWFLRSFLEISPMPFPFSNSFTFNNFSVSIKAICEECRDQKSLLCSILCNSLAKGVQMRDSVTCTQ